MKRALTVLVTIGVAVLVATVGPAEAQDGGDTETYPRTDITPDDVEGQGVDDSNSEPSGLNMYEVEVPPKAMEQLLDDGLDIQGVDGNGDDGFEVDVAMDESEAQALDDDGLDVALKLNSANQTVVQATTLEADNGFNVWRSWSETNGIRDELFSLVDQFPSLLEPVSIGKSVNGQDIVAVRLAGNNDKPANAKSDRPAVVYLSAQHAREWVTVEMNRRLLVHLLNNYNRDPEITELINTRDLWFILVANPDGYDYTFTEGNRLWRKNLADNNGDGRITADADGVDLNRNFEGMWGLDNEGSSSNPASGTYRGPVPNSEPETLAFVTLMRTIDPVFVSNIHSAAELLLYGSGTQVATPTPDDNILAALAGTDERPAVAGYDPDISAELYITNGTTSDFTHGQMGSLSFTPELDTCEGAEDIFPDDAFGDTYCEDEARSVFEFPDDEALIDAVFQKNLEFSLNLARSADDPTDPVTNTGLSAPDMVVDTFDVSNGLVQEVAVETRREYRNLRIYYSINGGEVRSQPAREWRGGERYGGNFNAWYGEFRGTVRGAKVGDEVTVHFEADDVDRGNRKRIVSDSFTYEVRSDGSPRVLILANEDYLGFGPEQPGVTAPRYVGAYADALRANNLGHDVWDVSADGVPHDLGVLSHYDLVVWELGDNRLTQEAEDVVTDTPSGPLRDLQVAESQQALTVAVRDFLNEGGKLFHAGEYTAYYGQFADGLGGAYYGLNGDPSADCVITESFFSDCLIFSNDFAQYYLGIWSRRTAPDPERLSGASGPFKGTYEIDGAATPSSGAFQLTSDVLPAADFPRFSGTVGGRYTTDGPSAFGPFSGEQYAAATHADRSWMRLTRTIDLTDASSAELAFQVSYDVEEGYDHLVVEARTVGQDDWTTLPDINGGTGTDTPTECEAGFLQELHPDLARYITGGATCTPKGTSGAWHSFTGNSGGWTEAAVDLSAYSGGQVEVSISYITDPGTGGVGVFVDDVVTTVDGVAGQAEGFEEGPGPFTIPGPPSTSPGNAADWRVTGRLFDPPTAVAVTEDTVTFGFGFEAIVGEKARADAMNEVLDHLLR